MDTTEFYKQHTDLESPTYTELKTQLNKIVEIGRKHRERYDKKVEELQDEYNVEEDNVIGAEEGFAFVIDDVEYHSDWIAERVTSDTKEDDFELEEHGEGDPAYEYANRKTEAWQTAMGDTATEIEEETNFEPATFVDPYRTDYMGTGILVDYELSMRHVPTEMKHVDVRWTPSFVVGTAEQVTEMNA